MQEKINCPFGYILPTHNSVENEYISYKILRFTFDRSAVKIDRRVLFRCAHVTETLHENLPVVMYRPSNYDKENHFV